MNSEQRSMLNGFFVTTFNKILAWEDQSLRTIGRTDLSVREMHIIEAVSILEGSGKNTMANIAGVLSVSPGSLTTAVNALVKKGYLVRRHAEDDRRMVFVSLTEAGERGNEIHKKFHDEMIEFVDEILDEESFDVLCDALMRLTEFLAKKENVKR